MNTADPITITPVTDLGLEMLRCHCARCGQSVRYDKTNPSLERELRAFKKMHEKCVWGER